MEIDHQEIEEVPLIEGTEKTVTIGRDLDPQIRLHLIQVLRQNVDKYLVADMPGIDPQVVTHKLNVYEGVKLLKQKKRIFGPEKDKIIEEVKKLLDAGFIEVSLSTVVGKRSSGKKNTAREVENVQRFYQFK